MAKINPVRNSNETSNSTSGILKDRPSVAERRTFISNRVNSEKKINIKEFLVKHKFIWIFAFLVALAAGFLPGGRAKISAFHSL